MTARNALRALFASVFLTMLVYTTFASTRQSMFAWGGLTTGPDRYWTIATMLDAYFGFLTFYVWVFYKELRWLPRIGWFIAIMLFGNMAMSAYMLLQLGRLRAGEPAAAILTARHG
jgi:isoprenylcysteine carboxyl methyltransferase (ICMT) family protein YpbQ